MKEKNLKEEVRTKNNNGITLIALVITIIVLLILAGVSIATLSGDNGVLNRAKEAKEKTAIAEELEQVELAVSDARIGNLSEGKDFKTELENSVNKTYPGSTVTKNGDKYTITLDNGHKYKVNGNGTVEEIVVSEDLDLAVLEKYVLGQDLEGRKLNEIFVQETVTFIDDVTTEDFDETELGVQTLSLCNNEDGTKRIIICKI